MFNIFTLFVLSDFYHSSEPMAKMGELGQMLDFMWQGNQNQGSSLQQKWWVVSRRTNRYQRLPCGWVSRFSLLQYYLLWFSIIPGPQKATPTPTVPPTATSTPSAPTTTPTTATPTPSYILRKISLLDLQICYSLFMSPIPQLMASRDVVLLIMVNC